MGKIKIENKAGYTREELIKIYPELALAYDYLIQQYPSRFRSEKTIWEGKNEYNGKMRRISIGKIISTLKNYGYRVSITITI